MLDVACPGCRRVLKIKEELAGRKGKCPHCGHALTVPAPAASGSSANMAGGRKALPPAAAEAATVGPEAARPVCGSRSPRSSAPEPATSSSVTRSSPSSH